MLDWKSKLTCAVECTRCKKPLNPKDQRILSVYDHEAICMECKRIEEKRPDYKETSGHMIGMCHRDIELMQKDPGPFCYHHFYPYTCD
ncbi:MAG: hypothetical protein M0P57_10190 [Syntrophales bacterium]|nr:hypothetical protein [Syntrophales bacterium]